jgi:hypothetical protein
MVDFSTFRFFGIFFFVLYSSKLVNEVQDKQIPSKLKIELLLWAFYMAQFYLFCYLLFDSLQWA